MPFTLDPGLRQYCTPRQLEVLTALETHGSERKAADALGVDNSLISQVKRAVLKKAASFGYAPDFDMVHPTPPGFHVKGASTLYDMQTGEARLQWLKTNADAHSQEEMMREAVDALCSEIKPAKPVKAPKASFDHLMSIYPVGDHHIGMLSWDEETSGSYDTSIAETLLISAMEYLVDAAPPSSTALILLMGDFLHYDSFESITPQSKHQLDADSRYPRLVRAAMRTVRTAISTALHKHALVRVIVEGGNHDPSSMVFLREALRCLYEQDPRVEIDPSPKLFHYYQFGSTLIGTHHGDKVKMDKLPLLMATDAPKEWGETKHRYIFTGHVHNDQVKDFNGARVESIRILPPADAWAYNMGYRTGRDMKRIEVHREFGEVARQLVTPEMIE